MMQDMFVENYRRPSSRLGGGEAEEDPDRIEVSNAHHNSLYRVQGLAKRWAPGCVNASGKSRQKR